MPSFNNIRLCGFGTKNHEIRGPPVYDGYTHTGRSKDFGTMKAEMSELLIYRESETLERSLSRALYVLQTYLRISL